MNNTYADGVFNTLRELAKSQQPNSPEFILQAFACTYGASCLGILPEFQVTEYKNEFVQAWEIGYRDRENDPRVVWIVSRDNSFVSTTCEMRGILKLEEVQVFPWSNLLWSEVASNLPLLNDNLWVESNQEAVKLLIGFTSLYYQSV